MLGAILIFTPDHGYVYSSVFQTTCKVKTRNLLWSEDKEVQGISSFAIFLA